jgi:membrane protease YdiL (CAAX protease family)
MQETLEKMVNVSDISGLIINLIMIAGLAAFGEELLFRSVLQSFLVKKCKNAHIGILITSIIFSLIHFDIYGFLPRLVLGLILGYMFYYSRSIWIPMAMHFVNNGTIVVLYFLNNVKVINIDVESFGQTNVAVLILSIIAMIVLSYFSIRLSNKEKNISTNN